MATATGRSGNVAFSGGAYANYADTYAHVYEWTATFGNEELITSAFSGADTEGHTHEMGAFQARGSLRAYADKTTPPPATVHLPGATESTLTLSFDGSDSMAFSAQLFNIAVETNVQSGLIAITADFVSTGDLTEVRA